MAPPTLDTLLQKELDGTHVQLVAARAHQLVGDCSTARRELADVLAGKPSAADASEARFRMAQCYLRDDAPDEALVARSMAELAVQARPAGGSVP